MKWLFVLFLAIIIFGGAYWFGANFVFKEDIQVRKEQRGEVTPEPRLDLTLPEYEAAAKLRQEGKIPEARAALAAYVQKYPTGKRGIRRQSRRRDKQGGAQDENDARADHADEQHEQHDASDRRTLAHFPSRFRDCGSAQTKPADPFESRRILQAVPHS
jgi:hypothetical protein